MLKADILLIFNENYVILATAVLSQYTSVTGDDRRHIMTIAMALQRSTEKRSIDEY